MHDMKQPPVIVVQLVHIQGPGKGKIQEFTEGVITIGRGPACHVRFPSDLTAISRRHAEIVRDGNQFKLDDHSTNGTFVNGKRVSGAYLKDGDVLEFSEGGPKVSFLTEMRDDLPEPQRPPAPAVRPPEPPVRTPEPPARTPEPPARAPEPPPTRPPEPVWTPPPEPRPEVSPSPGEGPPPVVKAPLFIQYGPMLKSYREVPVTIGRHPRCQFVIDHPRLLEQHAQIFVLGDRYWVRDLTGQRLVAVNRQPVGTQSPLSENDLLSLAPNGPVFRFLGQGRFGEAADPQAETPPRGTQKPGESPGDGNAPPKEGNRGIFSRFRRIID